jgi:hypothetical protein
VARYAQEAGHGHGKEGLLVLDSGEIDELVGVLTLCAMLEVSYFLNFFCNLWGDRNGGKGDGRSGDD